MKFTGATLIVRTLENLGVEVVAGIPGGPILPLYDALATSRIRHVLARHEQGAGFIAQGLARVTGKPGVCLATSGPGATNLLTALADAKMDSVPLVALTAQVPQTLAGTDAFQETDIYGLSVPICKHSWFVADVGDLEGVLLEAFRVAAEPRRGPVLVDIPKDVLTAEVEIDAEPFDQWTHPPYVGGAPDPDWTARAGDLLRRAQRPVVYAGGGLADHFELVREFTTKEKLPVAVTLRGLGLLPPDDPLNLGMLGMHGAQAANRALHEADVVLALGVRFDDRATGKIEDFCPKAAVIHVDVDASELGKNHPTDLAWVGDAGQALRALLETGPWRDPDETPARFDTEKTLKTLARLTPPGTIVTTDVGQHQMQTAQHFPIEKPGDFLTSGGLGTMGFGLPAAIGAALAAPGRRIVCITGDGSILMNVQELATLAENELTVTIVLFENGRLGLVGQQQELFYGQRHFSNKFKKTPDFCALARSFGIPAWRCCWGMPPSRAFGLALAEEGPSLVVVPIKEDEVVWPMVAPGQANIHALNGARSGM